MTDSATERTTKYHYDFLDRLMQYVETGEDYYHSVRYQYNTENNLSAQFENLYGGDFWNSYVYDGANRISAVGSYKTVKGYGYDAYGRTNLLVTSQDGNPTEETPAIKVDSFTFTDKPATSESEAGTSSQISTHTVVHGTIQTVYTYTYDDNGNITSISQKSWSILEPEPEQNPQLVASYVYDSANQLVRENNNAGGFTHTWTYDNAGNITSRKEYGYTTGELETPSSVVSYTYPDTDADKAVWGDLLLSYGEQTISYDENHIGNPKSDGVRSYTWEHGRQLASMTNGTTTWNYTYNADGLRTSKTDGTTYYSYVYSGDKLTYMIAGGKHIYFSYDASGTPMTIIYNGAMYYYVTNIQGDVIGLLDANGNTVATYAYDAWGNPITTSETITSEVGEANPLRYRGYVWDSGTKLYYLQSRYYNPEIGRFINADSLATTGQGFIGNNMFAFCLNNPAIYKDSTGNSVILTCILVGAVVGLVIGASGGSLWATYGLGLTPEAGWEYWKYVVFGGALGAAAGAAIGYCAGSTLATSAAISWAEYKAAHSIGASAYAIGRAFEQWFYEAYNVVSQQITRGICRFDAILNNQIFELKNYTWSKYSSYTNIINQFTKQASKYLQYVGQRIDGVLIEGVTFYFSSQPPEEVIKALEKLGVIVDWVR